MDLSINWKCSVTVAIISVIVYLLLVMLMHQNGNQDAGKSMDETEWFKSLEVMLLVSVFIAYNINAKLFSTC